MAGSTVDRVSDELDQGEDAGAAALEWGARLGFASRGVLYLMIGALAARIALGNPAGEQASQRGALAAIAETPFGTIGLVAVALGFAGYAIYRFLEAVYGRDDEDGASKPAKQVLSVGKGLIAGSLAVSAILFLSSARQRSSQSGGGSEQEQALTARVLEWPGGRWIVGLVGLGVIVGGVALVVQAVRNGHSDDLDRSRMPAWLHRPAEVLGSVGYTARGVVFVLAGLFVARAAWQFDPQEAKGLDGALRELAEQAYGTWLLLAAAAGLAAFGLHALVQAAYRKL